MAAVKWLRGAHQAVHAEAERHPLSVRSRFTSSYNQRGGVGTAPLDDLSSRHGLPDEPPRCLAKVDLSGHGGDGYAG